MNRLHLCQRFRRKQTIVLSSKGAKVPAQKLNKIFGVGNETRRRMAQDRGHFRKFVPSPRLKAPPTITGCRLRQV